MWSKRAAARQSIVKIFRDLYPKLIRMNIGPLIIIRPVQNCSYQMNSMKCKMNDNHQMK